MKVRNYKKAPHKYKIDNYKDEEAKFSDDQPYILKNEQE